MIDDIAEFLLARIVEDEDQARVVIRRQRRKLTVRDVSLGWIRAFDPKRVAAECEAKRQIVEQHGPDGNPRDEWYGSNVKCKSCGGYDLVAGLGAMGFRMPWPCRTLRLLALPYADHPDYRQEWKP